MGEAGDETWGETGNRGMAGDGMTAEGTRGKDMNEEVRQGSEAVPNAVPRAVRKLADLLFGQEGGDATAGKLLNAASGPSECLNILAGETGSTEQSSAFLRKEAADGLESLAGTVYAAVTELTQLDDESVSGESVSPEFFAFWRRGARCIAADYHQDLWAKLLVRKMCDPGGVSLRTLDVAGRLSEPEWTLFQKIRSCVLNNILPCSVLDASYPAGITYEDVSLMDECGLLNAAALGVVSRMDYEDDSVRFDSVISCGRYLAVPGKDGEDGKDGEGMSMKGLALTSVGTELVRVCAPKDDSPEAFRDLLEQVAPYISPDLTSFDIYERGADGAVLLSRT